MTICLLGLKDHILNSTYCITYRSSIDTLSKCKKVGFGGVVYCTVSGYRIRYINCFTVSDNLFRASGVHLDRLAHSESSHQRSMRLNRILFSLFQLPVSGNFVIVPVPAHVFSDPQANRAC